MIDINVEIKRLIDFSISVGLIDERDRVYGINRVLEVLNLDSYTEPSCNVEKAKTIEDILDNIRIWAVENNRVEFDSIDELDLFDTKIMAQLTKMPSEVESEFKRLYNISPKSATDYFYKLAKNTNYIREKRIAKDIRWKYDSPYGQLDITINLSKPEKDPRSIAKAKSLKSSNYPKCLLCRENEGYAGRLNHPARGNHRLIEIELTGEKWYLQYSPYVYYNEHCIVLKGVHEPMNITKSTFRRLLEFTEIFPHYFIGSNADLPIVGGSILTHDHYQGGRYTFPMAVAREENHVYLSAYGIEACTLHWPLSVIRLKGVDVNSLVEASYKVFTRWKNYSDESVSILAETNGELHNTVTPICRNRDGHFEMDLVLRNNRTTYERPYGMFHPRQEYHHIKKENIGLIEVLGLAVLPSRLKTEMKELIQYLLKGDIDGIRKEDRLNKHLDWAVNILKNYRLTEENVEDVLRKEIGNVFLGVLKDAGVFKDTESGKEAFKKCRTVLFEGMGGEM